MPWTPEQLDRLRRTQEIRVSPLRRDRTRYARPTIIWAVVVGDELVVRAYYGVNAGWYRTALAQGTGRIIVGEEQFDVRFAPPGDQIDSSAVDAAYRAKYAFSAQLQPMLSPDVAAATIVIRPVEE